MFATLLVTLNPLFETVLHFIIFLTMILRMLFQKYRYAFGWVQIKVIRIGVCKL